MKAWKLFWFSDNWDVSRTDWQAIKSRSTCCLVTEWCIYLSLLSKHCNLFRVLHSQLNCYSSHPESQIVTASPVLCLLLTCPPTRCFPVYLYTHEWAHICLSNPFHLSSPPALLQLSGSCSVFKGCFLLGKPLFSSLLIPPLHHHHLLLCSPSTHAFPRLSPAPDCLLEEQHQSNGLTNKRCRWLIGLLFAHD